MYRSSADRQAEAARYRQLSDQAAARAQIPTVSLALCHYKAHCGKLELSTAHTNDRLPASIYIKSHHTGKLVLFSCVKEGDPMFDYDQWDGEQQVYRPSTPEERVKLLVIHRFG